MRIKILVISHNCFSATRNNGKTLSSIFSAFSKEELCQLFFTPQGAPDFSRCNDYYLISDKDALRSVLKRSHCGTEKLDAIEADGNGVRKRIKATGLTKAIRSFVWSLSSWYAGGLNVWLEKQAPDCIFYVGGDGIFSHRIALSLSKRLGIPLATYFTDDYVINTHRSLYNGMLRRYYSRTINHSRMLFAVGERMAQEYSSFYSRRFIPIMNVIDMPAEEPSYNAGSGTLNINYFGGLHLGRDLEIARFGHFMRESVEPLLDKRIVIGIYSFASTPDRISEEYGRLGIEVHKGLSGDDLESAMKDTDVFLHVESADPEYMAMTSMSVSTKIPEYMGLAKPILAFGPTEIASFKVISDANDALVVKDDHVAGVDDTQIKRLAACLNDEGHLKSIAHDNYQYASKRFDRSIVARKFRQSILSMFDSHGQGLKQMVPEY